ncbi:alpha/beta fold hydrolase [Aeromicrobium chenweiae]|uniref:Alpha/beta hydrolase n=1 Tax=Aeromicrobium chenweiae TaxID=2079793 RepID=A0A2S0WM47_9ACTN|nr:alpha/beta hydrolase [Aeromicrobium chenweiae]AWB92429.1 alpha/beta hydrolase [Aeromicrobium chenweiae]TGN31283.1 alpha/beta hydrolase [Aeromicrobium chenweiae]
MSTPTYVFVPGAGGLASFWDLVRQRLDARDVPSVAVTLPGPDPSQGLPEYVDLVVDAAAPYREVVLVAQSLGGFSASWAADRIAPRELVLINAMIPRPGETAGEWWEATGSGPARAANDVREGRDPDAGLDADVYFFHDLPPETLTTLQPSPDETDTVFAAPWGPAGWPDVPTRVIAGADDRLFPLSFQRRVARERLGLEVETVAGGHLAALSRPDELAAAILRTM